MSEDGSDEFLLLNKKLMLGEHIPPHRMLGVDALLIGLGLVKIGISSELLIKLP